MRKALCILLVLCLVLGLAGCNPEESVTDISYQVTSLPVTIDPQIASQAEELCVVRNVFEGLTRINEKGNANLAAAKKYTVSADGTVYTFYLHKDKVWSDSTPLTAHDFVFGIRRAVDPATKSADKLKLSVIKGADDILAGNAAVDTLAIRALDDYTLEITLKASCPQFLAYLTSPAFMPCNETFFKKTNGKYGLDYKNTLYNGPYYVNGWKPEKNYISVKKSKTYVGDSSCLFDSVLLRTGGEDTLVTEFNEGKIHIITAKNGTDTAKYLNNSIYTVENTTCALYINNEFASNAMLSALKCSINVDSLSSSTGYNKASSIIPGSAILGNAPYYTSSSANIYNHFYDPDTAYNTFVNELSSKKYGGVFPTVSLLYPDIEGMEAIAKNIAAGWQSSLGAFVNIKSVSLKELDAKLASGDFAFALVPITAASNDAAEYMNSLANSNITVADAEFYSIMSSVAYSEDMQSYNENILKAEGMALATDNLVPLCHLTQRIICNKEIYSSLHYINGAFDFTTLQ